MGAPFLRRVATLPQKIEPTRYPFNVRAFSRGVSFYADINYAEPAEGMCS